ncbi:S9 family peptidase [Roseateles sp.]|uniref:S9 family peptidase n=1 Tax=Roseateles sp. TaxID=1971397 RepID=UPI002DFA12CF|nr:S9 family peptidase [Roseateles sp.]
MRHLLTTLMLTLATALPALAQPAPRPFDAEAANGLQRLVEPEISPDGRWVVYGLKTADVEKDKFCTDLWLAPAAAGGTPRRLTFSCEVAGKPHWVGPAGEAIAFLAARGGDDERKKGAQLWRLPVAAAGEAEKLTAIPGGIEDYALSPDGRRAALVVMDEAPDPETIAGWKRKTAFPIVIDAFHFKQDREGYLEGRHKHLQLLELDGRQLRALTQGEYDEAAPAWSPDGRRLAFLSNRAPERDRTEATGLFVMDAQPGATARQLATLTTDNDDARPAWSPDGRFIALATGDDVKWSAYQQWRVGVYDTAGGAGRVLGSLDRGWQPQLAWTPDGSGVVGVVDDDRHSQLARIALADGRVERLSGPGSAAQASVARDGRIAYLAGAWSQPAELQLLEPGAATPRPLTTHHAAWRAGLVPSVGREFSARSADGTEVHGLLALPPGARLPLPTVLLIHGGPNGQDTHDLGPRGVMRERLVAAGYAVLQVNYRGSSGRGRAFQRAIFGDWGHLEVQDLHAAVDWAVAQGIADPARLGVGGWSYGGLLTDYLIATDARFKAAVSGAGSGNQLGMFGVDQYAVQYEREMGAPWAQRERWLKVSYPFFKADRIRTPTLFLGGEKDFNVPIAGGEQMYLALKMLGVPTQLVVYPGQFHGLSLPSYQRDWEARFIAWMDRHLGTRPQQTSATK